MTSEIHCDSLWHGADIVTMRDGNYHTLTDGAIAVRDGKIVWIGEHAALPPGLIADETVKFDGGIVTPGFVDCHTHAVFGGNRSGEFEQRLDGVSYAEIAAQGGGIISTVKATREADEALLLEQGAVPPASAAGGRRHLRGDQIRLRPQPGKRAENAAGGAQTGRAAAGRGENHLPGRPCATAGIRRARRRLHQSGLRYHHPSGRRRRLADAVDAFCEHLAFSPAQVERVFAAAEAVGLPVKLHAEQLSALGGSTLAARHHALSADHLEYATEQDARAMGEAGTVAVLLPGAFYLLRETQCPPVELFRKHNVAMAIASDLNPGTSPALSLRLMLNMACTLFRLTPEEALAGVTTHAAKALGLQHSHGTLETGKVADFVHWPLSRPAELAYWLGGQLPCTVIFRGEVRQ